MTTVQRADRVPSLDGLRAIAIGLVLYSHLWLFGTLRGPDFGMEIGYAGVLIFFVISGYIITRLLLKGRERTGTTSLRAFYLRRAARILPPYLCYIFGLAILTRLRLSNASVTEILWSAAFWGDYRISLFPSLQHLWSLSVEEQFYLLWPLALTRLSRITAQKLLLAAIVISPVIRLIYSLAGSGGVAVKWHFESVADGLAMGCLLAMIQPRLHANRLYFRFARSWWPTLIPVVIWFGSLKAWPLFSHTLGISMVFLSVAIGIDVAIIRCESPVGVVLNSKILSAIGRWSYSLYLWQQIFLLQTPGAQPYAYFPLNLLISLSCAAGSFYLIERPAIAWGRRVSAVFAPQTELRLAEPSPVAFASAQAASAE